MAINVPALGATGTITVPSSTTAGIGLAAAANYKVSQDSQWTDYEDVVIVAALNGVAKAAANNGQVLTTATYTSVANQLRTWLNSNSPQNPIFADEAACLRYAIDSMVPVVNASPASPLLPGVLNSLENLKLTQLEVPIDPTRQYPADLASSSISATAYQFIADRIQEASDLAHNDAQFAAAVNPVLADLLGIDSTASYGQIQSLYPSALPTLPTPNNDGSFTINAQNLLNQYQSLVSSAQAILDADLVLLGSQSSGSSASAANPSFGARLKPLSSGATLACATANPLSLTILTNICIYSPSSGANKTDPWTPLQSDVTGLSKFIGLQDSRLASQVTTVGGGIVQAGKAIDQLGNLAGATSSIIGDLAPALSVLGPTGALVGAAVDIFSGLFGSGSNPNAAVLAQIQKLGEQIAKLQQDMDAQFKQVNATLSTILGTLSQDFAVLNGDAHAIQVGLLDLQTQLNQLAVYSLAYAQTQEYETLVQYLNGCLNYRAVHNGADMGLSQYNTCENELFTWANNDVTDQLWAGVQQPDYSNANIYNIFLNSSVTGVCSGCASPFSADVNYLAQFPAQNIGLPALAAVRLPNPEMWTLVARAYLQLAREWPQYTTTINSVHFDDLIQVGSGLQQAIHKANSTGTGAGIVTNQPLFNAVVSKYNTAVTSLQSAIQGVVNTYASSPPLSGINLWGGTSQSISHTPPANRIVAWCDGTPANTIDLNFHFVSGLPVPDGNMFTDKYFTSAQRAPFILGEYLGLGSIDYCIDASFENGSNKRNGSGLADVAIYGKYNGASIVRWSKRLRVWEANAGSNQTNLLPPGTDLYNIVDNNWLNCQYTDICAIETCNYLAQFQGTAPQGPFSCGPGGTDIVTTSYPVDATTAQNIINQVTSKLDSYQSTLYGQISSSFAAATPVKVSGQLLSGTKLLAQAYANFGLPGYLQTSSSLHGMLYGNGSILDDAAVQSDFLGFSTSVLSITDNKITDEIALLNSRSAALAAALTAALSQVQQRGAPDSLAQIDTTLADLQAFETLKNASALSACSYQLSSASALVGSTGGAGIVAVQELNGCNWKVSTNSDWVTVTSGASGTGDGTVSYFVASNPSGSSRYAVFIIGDQIFPIMQSGTEVAALQLVPGSLAQVSVGADGTVWGITSSGGVYTFSSLSQTWQNIPGSLSQIAAGAKGYVWGLNAEGDIYRFDPNTQNWDWIPGNLSIIAVGADGDVWGISTGNQIFHFESATQAWKWISGSLTQIKVGFDGAVWGLNAAGEIYRFNPGAQLFQQVPGWLSQIAVGADGDVWGINSASQVYHFNSLLQNWDTLPGNLTEISVGSAGNVWGLDFAQNVYVFNSRNQNWTQIPGSLKQVSAGANGAVWGVDSSNNVYQFVQTTQPMQTWHALPGALAKIAVGADGNVWGIDGADGIYHFNTLFQSWENVPGSLNQIAVGADGDVWGIDSGGFIYRFDAPSQTWIGVPGLLSKIVVGANGDVWGINNDRIYRFNPAIQNWDAIPGSLMQLSVGADGAVWGMNSDDQIWRFDPRVQNWDWIPGSLSQIAVGSANNVWGITSSGGIYRFDPVTQSWGNVPGNLSQISVAFDGTVWGLSSAGFIYRLDTTSQNWHNVPGVLSQIVVGADAAVWGLSPINSIYTFK